MFVFFDLKGKQYIGKKGDIIRECPYVSGQVGDLVYAETVLGVDGQIGSPEGRFIPGAKVELKIVKQGMLKKERVVNFRPQKRHEKWKGYRTKYTDLEIISISWSKS